MWQRCQQLLAPVFVSTSAFHGKGKRKTFSVACQREEYLTEFANLGNSFNMDQSTFNTLSNYVCHLYGQSSAKNVNYARYKSFCMASAGEQTTKQR